MQRLASSLGRQGRRGNSGILYIRAEEERPIVCASRERRCSNREHEDVTPAARTHAARHVLLASPTLTERGSGCFSDVNQIPRFFSRVVPLIQEPSSRMASVRKFVLSSEHSPFKPSASSFKVQTSTSRRTQLFGTRFVRAKWYDIFSGDVSRNSPRKSSGQIAGRVLKSGAPLLLCPPAPLHPASRKERSSHDRFPAV